MGLPTSPVAAPRQRRLRPRSTYDLRTDLDPTCQSAQASPPDRPGSARAPTRAVAGQAGEPLVAGSWTLRAPSVRCRWPARDRASQGDRWSRPVDVRFVDVVSRGE